MASDLEVLILIPAASHSAANLPSESWRSLFNEANRTTSSLPELGVEDHFHRVFSQMIPADPHYLLGPAQSFQLLPPPPGGDQRTVLLLSLPESTKYGHTSDKS